MGKGLKDWKVIAGLCIAAACLFFAFKDVDMARMWAAFKDARYIYFIPAVAILFLSHFLRAWRWQLLLAPIAHVSRNTLFTSLLIGYMANTFLPAHLGEFIRAYLVGKKSPVHGSAVFATIVIERIIDVFTLLILMAVTIIVFPFPAWVRKSGYISFAFIGLLLIILVLMKKHRARTAAILNGVLKPLPAAFRRKINELFLSFLDGVVGLQKGWHYLAVTLLSLLIWACYAYIFQLGLSAFHFIETYSEITWVTPLVLLVITTIAVLVPSSPGYIGTYHWLCQISLGLFGVPESDALSFAFAVHAVNFVPILVVGLILVAVMGMNLKKIQNEAQKEAVEIEGEFTSSESANSLK
ncbi:flippase-like domain-containing protein [candidate division KSB1 bacterium]|nr:flippase-like domain-containing protein [candidate division KSB1 bacterium]